MRIHVRYDAVGGRVMVLRGRRGRVRSARLTSAIFRTPFKSNTSCLFGGGDRCCFNHYCDNCCASLCQRCGGSEAHCPA